jgi:hypothetical protein
MIVIRIEGISIWFATFGPLSLLMHDRHELATMGGMP